ncbi:hypothetical protein DCAR_0414960 [Daucus carota subsp. sativus]|uniref:Uncharacterized protein n=1 Tax=Daucus carota subsp. sativus TaxID=79200 RepID=A0A165A490_DAUCS|nr:hypothetical protein DCAR_0414960 [Daucus carota subsp. sativus]
MGSCLLAMLMKGDDVYLMNVGDSRAILAQKVDLERISEETLSDLDRIDVDEFCSFTSLASSQLTVDHSTSVEEEVQRIKSEHRDDSSAIIKDRVKDFLKVTRAFGAGFLKQSNKIVRLQCLLMHYEDLVIIYGTHEELVKDDRGSGGTGAVDFVSTHRQNDPILSSQNAIKISRLCSI